MRAIKGATVLFGLANVPVDVCSAYKESQVKLRTLHAGCGHPVNQTYVCRTCQKEAGEDTIKGFEVSKGQFVFIEPEELERFAAPRQAIIEVTKFVPLKEIAPSAVVKAHWLQPKPAGVRTYETIARALQRKRVAAVAISALWGKENPVAIVGQDGALVMLELHLAEEAVPADDILGMLSGKVKPAELKLAEDLIDTMTGTLDSEDLRSRSQERVREFVAAKAANEPVRFPDKLEPVPAPFDLESALRRSLEDVQRKREAVAA